MNVLENRTSTTVRFAGGHDLAPAGMPVDAGTIDAERMKTMDTRPIPVVAAQAAVPVKQREVWPDVAKGACIVLVVLWHVITKHYQKIDWGNGIPVSAAWGTLGEQLLPLRMPLFFTISGLFALSAVDRPWPVLVRTRIARYFYLYVLWVLLHTLVMAFTPHFETARAHNPGQLLALLTVDPTNLWYLYALAAFFTLAKLTRPLPPAVVLTAAFALSALAATHLLTGETDRNQVVQNVVFFLAGLYLRPSIERFAHTTDRRRTLQAGGVLVVALLLMTLAHAQRWPGIWPAVSTLAAAFGITVAVQIQRRLPRPAHLLSTLGRRTLPVYVMHLPLLALLDALLRGPLEPLEPRILPFAALEPALLTGLLVALCLGTHTVLRRAGAGWLFELPETRSRRAGRSARHRQEADPAWFALAAQRQSRNA